MFDYINSVLADKDFSVVEQFELPARPARYAPIPQFLFDSGVGNYIERRLETSGGRLWLHQAKALDALERNENVVVSTGTASGKSLIFQTLAFHRALSAPGSRTLVFYPMKALAADQMLGWQKMARDLDLPESVVGRIDGSVPAADREEILDAANIILMTPDVCHAWLMYRLALPVIREFVGSLEILVMDEAHTLESVFGSNFAFLVRRLAAARARLIGNAKKPLQTAAATATISNPGDHLKLLTGRPFTTVEHEQDGSPQSRRCVAHVECPEGQEISIVKALQGCLLQSREDGTFITFLDSRRGVETLAIDGADDANVSSAPVLPYRAGYSAEERAAIERRLQEGSLKGIISTSALELGIDVPHLKVGINAGVPATRKSYRQRLGRIGRNDPGFFLIVAPTQAFRGFGTSFQEYHDMSVEPSYLYLDNRFMQFAHGRCLVLEQDSLSARRGVLKSLNWPDGFADMYEAARPDGARPPEFDSIAALGGSAPHHGYPLRGVADLSYKLKMRKDGPSIGSVNEVQALRECYPGGTYLHLGRAYEVKGWVTSTFEPCIRVVKTSPHRRTKPRLMTWINAGVGDVQDGNLISGSHGFLAECMMQITRRVEGYEDERSGKFHSYRELQQHDPNLRAQSRNFRTTGVVLHLDCAWFKSKEHRRLFVMKLRDVFVREYSIAPQDVGVAWSNITARQQDGGSTHGGCVAVFDETHGSLRLTERLFSEFPHLLERVTRAVRTDKNEELARLIVGIKDEVDAFTDGAPSLPAADAPTGCEQVFTPGSIVCYHGAGAMAVDVEIVKPIIWEDGNLYYEIKVPQKPGQSPEKRLVRASLVKPSAIADAWDHAWWNRATWEYEAPPNSD